MCAPDDGGTPNLVGVLTYFFGWRMLWGPIYPMVMIICLSSCGLLVSYSRYRLYFFPCPSSTGETSNMQDMPVQVDITRDLQISPGFTIWPQPLRRHFARGFSATAQNLQHVRATWYSTFKEFLKGRVLATIYQLYLSNAVTLRSLEWGEGVGRKRKVSSGM